jgi:hypothetical protein
MRNGERPRWDVRGHMVLCCGAASDQFEYRLRCYPDGHSALDIGGITYPIPRTMTAAQYFEMIFARKFGPPGRCRASGD